MGTTTATVLLLRRFFRISLYPRLPVFSPVPTISRAPSICIRFMASECGDGGEKKVSSRLSQMQKIIKESEERSVFSESGPTPKITLGAALDEIKPRISKSNSFC